MSSRNKKVEEYIKTLTPEQQADLLYKAIICIMYNFDATEPNEIDDCIQSDVTIAENWLDEMHKEEDEDDEGEEEE